MPRCKNIECKQKFTAKYFLQKYCSKECREENIVDWSEKLNQKSEKRKEQEAIYNPIRKAFLLKNKFCEICANSATEVHHKNGRNGERLTDVNYFMAICRGCHQYVHEHPKVSRYKGWLI